MVLSPDGETGTWIWHKYVTGGLPHDDPMHTTSSLTPITSDSRSVLLTCSLKTGSTSVKDPSQAIFENGDPLPAGFSIAFDDEGDVFFIE